MLDGGTYCRRPCTRPWSKKDGQWSGSVRKGKADFEKSREKSQPKFKTVENTCTFPYEAASVWTMPVSLRLAARSSSVPAAVVVPDVLHPRPSVWRRRDQLWCFAKQQHAAECLFTSLAAPSWLPPSLHPYRPRLLFFLSLLCAPRSARLVLFLSIHLARVSIISSLSVGQCPCLPWSIHQSLLLTIPLLTILLLL